MFLRDVYQYFFTISNLNSKIKSCLFKFILNIILRVFKCANDENKAYRIWKKFRQIILIIVENIIFEIIILLTIFLSSLALCFEDVNLKTGSQEAEIIKILDYVFTGIFIIEMILKIFGLGIKKYFTDPWCLLDFFIVIVNFFSKFFILIKLTFLIGFNSKCWFDC